MFFLPVLGAIASAVGSSGAGALAASAATAATTAAASSVGQAAVAGTVGYLAGSAISGGNRRQPEGGQHQQARRTEPQILYYRRLPNGTEVPVIAE